MLETKEQKQYLAATLILAALLGVVSFWRKPDLSLKNNTVTNKKSFDYNAYLNSIQVSPQASKQLFEELVTEDQVRQEMVQALKAGQPVVLPDVDNSKIKTEKISNQQSVVEYLQSVGQIANDFNNQASNASQKLFAENLSPAELQVLNEQIQEAVGRLYQLTVPGEVAAFHKSLLSTYLAYADTVALARSYAADSQADPWPALYNNYAVINSQMAEINSNLEKLNSKYQISQILVYPRTAGASNSVLGIKTAQAAFGIGDATIIIGNIPQAIEKAIREGLAAAFANFATQFLNKLIAAIESNYKIANFLYYTDALVQGQYVNDYLNKYVKNSLDRALVTNFIPQFNCGQAQDLKEIYKAKADQYLGFDPESVSPKDPQFSAKMARIGSFLSTPDGWQLYYQDLALAAQSEAEKAAERELTSSGIKSPRDALGTQIAASLSSINSSIQAIMNAQLNLGVVNASEIISKLVSQVTYNLFNKFVFRGAVVYKEQSVCLSAPEIKPIIPAQASTYQDPSAVDPQVIEGQECSKLPRGCQYSP